LFRHSSIRLSRCPVDVKPIAMRILAGNAAPARAKCRAIQLGQCLAGTLHFDEGKFPIGHDPVALARIAC
jgi:hypothetical protein